VNPAATTTPSSTIDSPPSLASRIGAPRSSVPVANYSVYLDLIYSRDNGSSSAGVIS
jgi:hypothetical protein